MKSVSLIMIFIITAICGASAQKFSYELQTMVDAENAFAKFSKEKNMRDAFLANLTESTILYTKSRR